VTTENHRSLPRQGTQMKQQVLKPRSQNRRQLSGSRTSPVLRSEDLSRTTGKIEDKGSWNPHLAFAGKQPTRCSGQTKHS
jgi:hypothetical protein